MESPAGDRRKGINQRKGRVSSTRMFIMLPTPSPLCPGASPLSQDLPEGRRSLFLVPSAPLSCRALVRLRGLQALLSGLCHFLWVGETSQWRDRHAVCPSDVGCCAGLGPGSIHVHTPVCVCVYTPGSGMWHVGRWPFGSVATAPLTAVAPMPQRSYLGVTHPTFSRVTLLAEIWVLSRKLKTA